MKTLFDPDRAAAALRFAASAHAGQTVPGSDLPYLTHVVAVAFEVQGALAAEPAHDADLAMLCALLHDTVEDTDATLEDLTARFGPAVAAGVAALTKDAALPKAERMADSLARIRRQPSAVWVVKLADRIVNLNPPPAFWPADKRRAYQAEAGRIADALGEASPALARRIAARITAYSAFIEP